MPKPDVAKPAAPATKPKKKRPEGMPSWSSSLVRAGSDAARLWMTPLIVNASKLREGTDHLRYDYQRYSRIHVMNPDREASLQLVATCYDLEGARKGPVIEQTVAPLSVTFFHPPGEDEVWCQVATNLPSVAYLSFYHFRRHSGDTPDTITEQKVAPLFKLMQ